MQAVRIKAREEKKDQAVIAVQSDQQAITGLVIKAVGGDYEAFGGLYGIYLDRIYRYVFYQVKDKMTAEDITEEVFVKAWKAIGSCKGREATFSSWLYRIAHNHMVDAFRSRRECLSLETEEIAGTSCPEHEEEAKLERRELAEMLARLPQSQRQVIILKFVEGLENREIGKIMGKREGAIRVLQMRGLAALRQKLSREKDYER